LQERKCAFELLDLQISEMQKPLSLFMSGFGIFIGRISGDPKLGMKDETAFKSNKRGKKKAKWLIGASAPHALKTSLADRGAGKLNPYFPFALRRSLFRL
jgi:hypothetical protein